MLVSFYFLTGRRFCRRLCILTGLTVFTVAVYVVVALTRLVILAWVGDVADQPPICLRPQLDDDATAFQTGPDADVVEPLHCRDEPDWIDPSNGTFRITSDARRRHGDIVCQYVAIFRGRDDFQIVTGDPVKPMPDGQKLSSDFFEARCVGSDGAVHVGLYSSVVPEPVGLERCRSAAANSIDEDRLDILIFGFDSVSRTAWRRQLARSHEFIVSELGGHAFTGYNIVGDGTPQALLPLLTGRTETELPEARRGFSGAGTVDRHPWIWRQLKDTGYVTQWGEDSAAIGTFTYRMLGFDRQPVDHYMRTFYLAAERMYPTYRPFCIGSTPRHVNMLAWQRQFVERYSHCRKFSFVFHSEFSHDDSYRLPLADGDLRRHLAALRDAGHLEHAVLVLMSDHGPRYDDLRRTTRGKYDERLPYLAVRIPPSFAARHPAAAANLRLNAAAGRLVTMFDVHATLLDAARLTPEPEVKRRNGYRLSRGISLFNEVPADRTCADADIAPHWCACLRWEPLPVDSAAVKDASQRVVDAVNSMTSPHRGQCALLHLDDVIEADSFADDDRLLHFRRSSDIHGRVPEMTDTMNATETLLRVVVRTQPNNALYEATLRQQLGSTDGGFVVDSRQISRINPYGQQPACVTDRYPHLRPYCYCHLTDGRSTIRNRTVTVGS